MLILYITVHVDKHNGLTVLLFYISPSQSPSLCKFTSLLCDHNCPERARPIGRQRGLCSGGRNSDPSLKAGGRKAVFVVLGQKKISIITFQHNVTKVV